MILQLPVPVDKVATGMSDGGEQLWIA